MGNVTIYPKGTADITVPAGQSIAISNFGGGIAQIYYLITAANAPPAFQFQQTLENGAVVLGPFTDATVVRIEANNSKVIYDVGASPDTGIGDADTLNGLASDTADTADTIVARDGSGDITANVFESTVATGTAPMVVSSTTVVTNFNADMVDGIQGSLLEKVYRPTGSTAEFTTASTLTPANLKAFILGIGSTTAANFNLTLPSEASTESYFSSMTDDTCFQFSIANNSSTYSATIVNNGWNALYGKMMVSASTSAMFGVRKISSGNWIFYRMA